MSYDSLKKESEELFSQTMKLSINQVHSLFCNIWGSYEAQGSKELSNFLSTVSKFKYLYEPVEEK